MKQEPVHAAQRLVDKRFPNCSGAILAGSIVRGEWTTTSDLDIVIFDAALPSPYRESFIDYGWPIELFAHNLTSYPAFFETDCKRARPSLPRMVSEGVVLRDNGIISSIKQVADELLKKGPEPWSVDTINTKRYFLTDALDDFIGCENREEGIMIANALAEKVSEFVLRTNKQWIGASKWISRSLKQYDSQLASDFYEAFDDFYKDNLKEKVIRLVDHVLLPYGGRLFEGFSQGKV
ncbi:nucleotidyltransferase domain-containing protein [Pullulanibacillus sp. KACC 23026]|uniref:nucleotidyltransferase domain-containing protein n=1 Tax=Pullulanibacillus sp. KACC 23026 TaxID=3028315 RepID=UPI0023AE8C71|nr:nucleotidyltransferase domain-containing protein [Pullulanibacillus sp. KACC 23026]WEG10915.1 nucleotidyltransferase domain-containing protein [Pullulanibacillus sp. KACC 23026]